MGEPEHLVICGQRAIFRPVGQTSLDEATAMVDAALLRTREAGISQLLVDATGLSGFPVPSLIERYFITSRWANLVSAAVVLALVIQPEFIDPSRFGVTVARNRGMLCDVFSEEQDAVAWLDRLLAEGQR